MTGWRALATLAVLLGVGLLVSGARAQCPSCANIVSNHSVAVGDKYKTLSKAGPFLCTTNAAANRFGSCSSDAQCGGTAGACRQTPWLAVGGTPFSFPTGVSNTYTITATSSAPSCQADACIGCGSQQFPCPGTPGDTTAGHSCCSAPGVTVPAFCIPLAPPSLIVCSRVDQRLCGDGVVNTSNPQSGDNEVNKVGDTTDPGPDCKYGTADDPAPKACTTAGAGGDIKGRIITSFGNGAADANGIHSRFRIPLRSTTWMASSCTTCPCAACPATAKWNGASSSGPLLTQFDLVLHLSTAGGTAQFQDISGDGCAFAGAGFGGSPANAGPITVSGSAVKPQPYGGGDSQTAAIGTALSGAAPNYDVGFVVITTFAQPTLEATGQSCSCAASVGCPE